MQSVAEPVQRVIDDTLLAEEIYGFKFTVCDYGTKDVGNLKDYNDRPLTAHQVEMLCRVKSRNVKILTGEISGCFAVEVDTPETVTKYLALLGTSTMRIKTKRGYAWLFKWNPDLTFNKERLPDGAEVMGNRHTRTFTGRHPAGVNYEVECWPSQLATAPDWLVTQIRQECDKRRVALERAANRPAPLYLEGDLDLAMKALACLDPDMNHDDWTAIGMALHDLDPVSGLDLWDHWSAGSAKYKPGLCAIKWRSFKKGAITRGTLFGAADRAKPGWRPAPIKQQRQASPAIRTNVEPIEPGVVTMRLAAEINRFFQHQAEAVLEVYRAALRFFRGMAFTAKQIIERSGLSKAQVHRGLMYGRSFLFERTTGEPHNDDLVAVCTRESYESIGSGLLEDPNSLQSATKSIPGGSRPVSFWKLLPYEQIVRVMCYNIFYIDLERSLDYKLATASRVKDLKGDISYVGKINRTLQKLMDTAENVGERDKIRKMAIKIRLLRHDLRHDLQPVGEGHYQTGKCEEKSVRQLMAEEWHWDRRDTDKTWDCERVLGMAKSTVQRMGRAVGFRWKPKMEPQVVTRGCDLPTPHKYSLNQHGFPRSVIVGGSAKPYFSAHYVAERMEVLNAPATIMWQKGSTIVYEPNEAALEADHKGQSNGKRKATRPVRGECGSVGMEQPEWNYQGNPPNWTRVNWAYYWLNRMGYRGDYDDLTDYQILEMLSTDRGTLKGEK